MYIGPPNKMPLIKATLWFEASNKNGILNFKSSTELQHLVNF